MGKVSCMLWTSVALAVTIIGEKIAAGLGNLGSIPIIGIVFKGLAFPFSIIAKLKTVVIVALCVMVFFFIVFPILKKISAALKKRKKKKDAVRQEDEIFNDMEQQTCSSFAGQTETHRIDF